MKNIRKVRQALTMLLCAAMILTSVPQTGMVSYAAENDVVQENLNEDKSDGNTETNDENDPDDDNSPVSDASGEEDGEDASEPSGDDSDGTVDENTDESTDQETDSEDEINPDDAEDDGGEEGDATEDGEAGEEGGVTEDGEDAEEGDLAEDTEETEEDVYLEEEENSVSMNTVSENTTEPDNGGLNYVGDVDDSDGESFLIIQSGEIWEQNHKSPTNKEFAAILRYWADRGEKFDGIIAWMDASLSPSIGKDVGNAAVDVLTEGGWLQLGFYSENLLRGFVLHQPGYFASDIKVTYTETLLANQGVKVKFNANSAIPAESVYFFSEVSDDSKFAGYDSCLGTQNYSPAVFCLKSGNPTVRTEDFEASYVAVAEEGYTPKRGIEISDLNAVQFNTEYLLTPVYEDEEAVPAGATKQLKAGERSGSSDVSGAKWTSLDPDIASIDANGLMTAWEPGEFYYYVKYNAGKQTYLEVHRAKVSDQEIQIAFDEDKISMTAREEESDRQYLRLRFYPSSAECDQSNPDQIQWTTSDPNVVSLVKYDENGDESDEGNPNGEVLAVGEGTAVITASYMRSTGDGEDASAEAVAAASCTITVTKELSWDDVQDQVEAMNLYAVTNLDTKLSDIKLPANWAWKEDMSLDSFKGTDGHTFAAVYTEPDSKKTYTCNLWVRMVTVTGVSIVSVNMDDQGEMPGIGEVPSSISENDCITLGRSYEISNLDGETEETYQTEYNAVRDRMDARYSVEWTSNPKNLGKASGSLYTYTGSITGKNKKAEKKTFTVSMKDKNTKKVAFKDTCTITVTIGSLYDFDKLEGPWIESDDNGKMWLCYRVCEEDADQKTLDWTRKLTMTSEDTSILKLTTKNTAYESEYDEEEDACYTYIRIPCENKKPGTAWIKITAPDEMKSVRRDYMEFVDREPKIISASSVTINKAMEEQSAEFIVRTHEKYPIDTAQDLAASLKLNKKSTAALAVQVVKISGQEEENYNDYKVTLSLTEKAASDKNLKKGKNTVTLNFTVKPENTGEDGGYEEKPATYPVSLTLNIADTKPAVKFKQTSKVNLFYTDEEGWGVLEVNGDAEIQDLKLNRYTDSKNPKKNKQCDFELKEQDGTYYIALKANGNAKNNQGTLTYKIPGYAGTFSETLKVSTETKKPALVLSAKSDTLYPAVWYTDSWLAVSDKATGERIEPAKARYVVNKNKKQYTELAVSEFTEDGSQEKTIKGKNTYNLLVTPDGDIVSRLQETGAAYNKGSDKFNVEIKEANWAEYLTVSYSVSVSSASPKLAFGASTLTLNKNSGVYRAQMARTSLRLKGCSNSVMQDDYNWVTITGQDDKSKKALKTDNSLVLQYWNDSGDIIARFNNNKVDTGTYKFKVTVGNDEKGAIASAVLNLKVVDVPVSKSLKVTAKGNIDVLDREGTYIAYTPKITGLSGTVDNGWLEGRDANLFDYEWMEDGRLIVRAREGESYSTKNTYQVKPAFHVQTEDYDGYEIRTDKAVSVKLKQGKPKLKASAANNTLYRQIDSTVEIRLDAVLNKKDVAIEDVWLLNYTEDLELRTTQIQAEDSDEFYDVTYNPETKSVTLALRDKYSARDIISSGKNWKVKLAVRYRDKAGNEKNAEVTCPVIVK